MSMKAALYDKEKGLSIGTTAKPQPKARDLLVKIAAAGLCASDFACLYGQQIPVNGYPVIPGHEGKLPQAPLP